MSLPCAKIVVVIVVLVLNIDSVDACKRGIARVVTATTKNAVNAVHSVRNTLSRINGALSGSRSTRLSQRRLFQNSIHRIKSGRISHKRLKAPSKSQTSSAGSKVSTKELSSIDEIDSDVDALIKVSKSSSDPLIEEAPSGFYIRNTVDTAAPGPSTAMKEVKPSTSKAGRPPLSKNKSTMHQNRFKYEI